MRDGYRYRFAFFNLTEAQCAGVQDIFRFLRVLQDYPIPPKLIWANNKSNNGMVDSFPVKFSPIERFVPTAERIPLGPSRCNLNPQFTDEIFFFFFFVEAAAVGGALLESETVIYALSLFFPEWERKIYICRTETLGRRSDLDIVIFNFSGIPTF